MFRMREEPLTSDADRRSSGNPVTAHGLDLHHNTTRVFKYTVSIGDVFF